MENPIVSSSLQDPQPSQDNHLWNTLERLSLVMCNLHNPQVTHVLVNDPLFPHIIIYDIDPDSPVELKNQAANDPNRIIRLCVVKNDFDLYADAVVHDYSPQFRINVLKSVLAACKLSVPHFVSREMYEEAALVKILTDNLSGIA